MAALHVAALLGLLALHIVDVGLLRQPAEPAVSYITLPVLRPAKLPKPKRALNGLGAGVPYFNPEIFALPGRGAITVPDSSAYVASHQPKRGPRCPLILRKDSPEWKRLCSGQGGDAVEEDNAIAMRNAAIFQRVEAEMRARNKPLDVPCTYTKKDPSLGDPALGGGPREGSVAMADIGCAAKRLFGN